MIIHLINPNSTASMTQKIEAAAKGAASPGTTIRASNPEATPKSIEGHADEAVSTPHVLAMIEADVAADAFILACFDDPGLHAAREITKAPVIGIAEAAMTVAATLARRFSIVTTLPRAVPIIEDLVADYGHSARCRRVRSANIPVLALEEGGASAAVRAEVGAAITQDGADAVVLGCAGMADLAGALTTQMGVPVIDGVVAATRLAEAIAGLGLGTSKAGAYAFPTQKG
ncbi:MAG: aspartate/glutamate racemase family protein [Pseudomonadota bacterium]